MLLLSLLIKLNKDNRPLNKPLNKIEMIDFAYFHFKMTFFQNAIKSQSQKNVKKVERNYLLSILSMIQ